MTHTSQPRSAHDAPVARVHVLFPSQEDEMTVNEMVETNNMAQGDQRRTRNLLSQEAKKSMQSDMCEADMYASAGRTAE